MLSAFLDRLGWFEAVATIAGFSCNPVSLASVAELAATITQLREMLDDQTYESLSHKDEAMTSSAIVTYAYHQIDQVRTELKIVSE